MKYKVLLTGKNGSVISDFFAQMNENFEVLSTSDRYEDIVGHLKYFLPDVFVYCIANETRDNIVRMSAIKYKLSDLRIPFVLVGAEDECQEFERLAINVSNLTLVKPMSAVTVQKKIIAFLERWQPSAGKAEDSQEGFLFSEEAKPPVSGALFSMDEYFNPDSGKLKAVVPQRKHILVVDDAPMMLKTIKEYLHGDYDIATAVSGAIALKFLEKKKTNLILLDYEMPVENGPAVLEKLRANPVTRNIPVVFLTGVSEREKIQEALALKPQGYLLKPIDREKLLDVIHKVIG